ncbi:hypothetical protein EV361DRAFT_948400 [Lentinula raphanica]|nr:hypothetical protein EV361DRAFT_948400 [Lentinula raphanica]
MTRLALPAILVIGAFSSAALAAPVPASPWSSTGTPTPLPEHNVASSQAHHVSSRDVHSHELTTRGLAISRLLGANTQNNPTTTDSSVLRLHDLWDDDRKRIVESRHQRRVDEKLDALDFDDWQALIDYNRRELREAKQQYPKAVSKAGDPDSNKAFWDWRVTTIAQRWEGSMRALLWAKRQQKQAVRAFKLAKKRAASANTVPKKS